ncbi:MAG: mechanosensitive ion channel family protein [Muribaculum sp.]|nr:mechanosensitive ion channel family protein [Muribaculum sp.]
MSHNLLGAHSLIPTHKVATWLLSQIDGFLTRLGLERSSSAEQIIYTALALAMALLVGWIVRKAVVAVVQKLVYSRHTIFVDELQHENIVNKMSHIIPPLVFLGLIPFAFQTDNHTLVIIERVVLVYFVVVLGWTICSLFNIIWTNYDRRENTKNLPLKGILNVAKGLVWIIIAIIAVSILVDRSPAVLLTGLGAFAAALMLIFKDSILGFVAGLQLSVNDMLRVGDWISVPGTIANGIVTDVSLTAVKVRNWDNTTVTLPPYTLVSTSFQNWNKMKERGRRQIERSVWIDISTVRPTTPEMLEAFKLQPFMTEYIELMQADAAKGQSTCLMHDDIKVNGSIDTNLGCYRAYVGLYLHHHPYVAMGGPTCMVRLMQQTATGVPLQIFCYLNTTEWVSYEGIQSDIFEHIMAAAPAFGLSAFSSPTGRDMVNIANPKPEAMPYNGDAPVAMSTYDPITNFMVPPNVSGDHGFAYSTEPVYPDSISEAVAAAKAAGIPVMPSSENAAPTLAPGTVAAPPATASNTSASSGSISPTPAD